MKWTKLASKYFLPVIFVLILFSHIINQQFQIYTFERTEENRRFKDSIEIDFSHLDRLPKDLNEYLSDNFIFRTPFLRTYHRLKFYRFKVSPHPNKTLIGNSGWYFMGEKERKITEGKLNFTKEQLQQFQSEWQRRKQFLDSLNIKFYWIIAPIKHHIYNKYLPFSIYQAKHRRVELLKAYMSEYFPDLIIDPVPILQQHKDSIKLFYRLDNHWNFRSGKLASEQLLSVLRKDFPKENIPTIPYHYWSKDTIRKGIHHRVLGIDELWEIEQTPIFPNQPSHKAELYDFPPNENFPYPWEYQYHFVNEEAPNHLKVLYIRDSFTKQMIPFVRDAFLESIFIFDAWQYQLNKDIILKYQPDIVIFESLEVHLETFIKQRKR